MAAKNPSLYRAIHHMRHGGLHRALGVPEGTKIPESKLKEASHSDNPHIQHMLSFAKTLKSFKH